MANLSIFERLPAELHDLILEHLTLHDNLNLSQVSRYFHNLIAPRVYKSWTYHGHAHSSKSLRLFLRTVLESPWIGSLVETMDLREWGDCPRLEDHYHPNWYVEEEYTWDGSDGEDQGDINEGGDESREVPNDVDNGDPDVFEANADADNDSPEVFEVDAAVDPDEMYDEYIPLFLKAMEDIEFGECTGEYRTCHECRILQRDEDVLISLLVWNLPKSPHTLSGHAHRIGLHPAASERHN